MFELQLKNDSLFLDVLESILDLVDVASVDCISTGLRLQAVDTEHVAMISLLFPPEFFSSYNCEKNRSICIPIDNMVKAIRSSNKDDIITIKVGKENLDISLSFESPGGNIATAYDLLLVEGKSPCFEIPGWRALDSKYQAIVKMPFAEFVRVCKYLSNIGSDGDISVTKKGLKFSALGKSGRVNIKYKKAEEATVEFVMQKPVSVTFDLKYVSSFAKVSTTFGQAKPEMEEEEIEGSGEGKEGSECLY
ncbi:unnamed protein product [Urochloa decumbens]|uniref:DNA sliding clamp PCNA n=1 Tax=Urochloa decumbens TaxID=240449 RepID=A0ABC9ABT2_9POAL